MILQRIGSTKAVLSANEEEYLCNNQQRSVGERVSLSLLQKGCHNNHAGSLLYLKY